MRYCLASIKQEGNLRLDSGVWVKVYKWCFRLAKVNPYLGKEGLLIRFVWAKFRSAFPTCVSEEESEMIDSLVSSVWLYICKVSASKPMDVSTSSGWWRLAFDRHPIRKVIVRLMNINLNLYLIMLSYIFFAKITIISHINKKVYGYWLSR